MEKISALTYLNCLMSRLAYLDVEVFADRYEKIFSLAALRPHLKTLRGASFSSMGDDTLSAKTLKGLSESVTRIMYPKKGGKMSDIPSPSKDMAYVSISTSNYSTVYVVADKRTKCITIAFRGTASPKGIRSYMRLSSSIPTRTCSDENKDAYLIGIFKLVSEMFYTISEAVHMLSKEFLGAGAKLVVTGHSLGGACAQIFTYLWIKTHTNKSRDRVCCHTFAAPRVMNVYAADNFAKFVEEGRILFRRVVTMGDPIPHLPVKSNSLTDMRTYSHPDETRDIEVGGRLVLLCANFKKTRKNECMSKDAVKRNSKWTRRANTSKQKEHHGNYMGVRFNTMSKYGLFNPLHEVKRNMSNDTICRVIVGSHASINLTGSGRKSGGTTISFFNLQMIKTPEIGILEKVALKIKKTVATDYAHADVYMSARVFADILHYGSEMTSDTNPLRAVAYVALDLEHVAPRPQLICV